MIPTHHAALSALVGSEKVEADPATVREEGRDFYWHSPLLKEELDPKGADLSVDIPDVETLRRVVGYAAQESLPLTVRGSATGNYGQCVPLHGGLLLKLSSLKERLEIDVEARCARVSAGVLIREVEMAARRQGLELRTYPSTWMKATVGGLIGGGAGGIGALENGLLRDPGNLRAVTIMTVEPEPQLITLSGEDAQAAHHSFGSTGIIVEAEIGLTEKRDWDQFLVGSENFMTLFRFGHGQALQRSPAKRLVSLHEWPIPSWFPQFRKFIPDGRNVGLFEVERSARDAFSAAIEAAGLEHLHFIPAHEPRKPPMLSDCSYNNTTMWAMRADPELTYVTPGFGSDDVESKIAALKAHFGDEIALHLEIISRAGKVHVGSLSIVRTTPRQRFLEILDYLRASGLGGLNPHSYYADEKGYHPDYSIFYDLKKRVDPQGLLNPGKLRHYPLPQHLTPVS